MRRPISVWALEDLGRVRLAENFFMPGVLYSATTNHYGNHNIPDEPEWAIAAGRLLQRHKAIPFTSSKSLAMRPYSDRSMGSRSPVAFPLLGTQSCA